MTKYTDLEPYPERHLERARRHVIAAALRLTEQRPPDVAGGKSQVVTCAGRIRSDRGVPGDEFLVVENVVQLQLHPRPGAAEDRHAVGEREIEHAVSREALRASRR